MDLIPQRFSLSNEVVRVLREGLKNGRWSECLPGERTLCDRLHVSRATIRAALSELRREGRIEVAHGRRSRILQKQDALQGRPDSRVVCMLSPVPLHTLRPFVMLLVDETRERLAAAGYRLEVEASRRYYTQRPYKALEGLVHQNSAACWNLFHATSQIQKWFAEKGLPVVVNGSSHPGAGLPSVDLDYRATCRHAASACLGKGRRHIALLIENIRCAGDEESRIGFLESAQTMPGAKIQLTVAEHDGTVPGVIAKVDSLLRLASPPTGLLVANSMYVLTVMGYLARRRVQVPDQISVISRDDDWFLNYCVPSVARYSCSPAHFANEVSHLLLQQARGESVPRKPTLLVPNFINGETLG
jgi:DNA-binding LacI/PurR family transcriptional regulator